MAPRWGTTAFGCQSEAGNEMIMWPFRGLEVNRAPCDLSFMEAINQRMQVPNRLKVADESNPLDEEREAEELHPSFQMHIPDRLSLAEMMNDSRRPFLLDQLRQHPSIVVHMLQDTSTQPAEFGELLFLDTTTQSGTQKQKRSTHHGRLRKERTRETPQIALRSTSWKPDRPGISPLPSPSPPFPQDARIYSPRNIFQMVYFLGHLLFHHVKKSVQDRAQSSSQDAGPASESSLEEIGVSDIIAMRKQLNKISGRLRTLEEQCTGWRQKELLVYSVLVSACLINTWLWLRR